MLGMAVLSSIATIVFGRVQSIVVQTKYYLTLLLLLKMNVLVLVGSLSQKGHNLK